MESFLIEAQSNNRDYQLIFKSNIIAVFCWKYSSNELVHIFIVLKKNFLDGEDYIHTVFFVFHNGMCRILKHCISYFKASSRKRTGMYYANNYDGNCVETCIS